MRCDLRAVEFGERLDSPPLLFPSPGIGDRRGDLAASVK
jgi:hypothetical protein